METKGVVDGGVSDGVMIMMVTDYVAVSTVSTQKTVIVLKSLMIMLSTVMTMKMNKNSTLQE